MFERDLSGEDKGLLSTAHVGAIPFAPASRWRISEISFSMLAWLLEAVTIICVAAATGVAYHYLTKQAGGDQSLYFSVGALAMIFYTLPLVLRDEYQIAHFLQGRRGIVRIFGVWTFAFFCMALVGFLTKTTGQFSRGWLLIFYCFGFVALIAIDALVSIVVAQLIKGDWIATRRVMLVGAANKLESVCKDLVEKSPYLQLVAVFVFPKGNGGEANWDSLCMEVTSHARSQRVNDVLVVNDWSQVQEVDRLIHSLSSLPVSVHIEWFGKS